jgi:hypothetical protein
VEKARLLWSFARLLRSRIALEAQSAVNGAPCFNVQISDECLLFQSQLISFALAANDRISPPMLMPTPLNSVFCAHSEGSLCPPSSR